MVNATELLQVISIHLMKYILIGYNQDPSWVKEYTDDWLIYDRSETPIDFPNTLHRANIGNADYDRLTYLIDNYDNLPDVFVLSKVNLFKYISKEEFDLLKDNKTFTPLLTQDHITYVPVCYYEYEMYYELNNSWYALQFERKFNTYNDWADYMELPKPQYLAFAPGGNYILTRDVIHRFPKEFYGKMRKTLEHAVLPAEAHYVERSLYTLWK